ncbi:hypothetical protein [Cohnella sp. 56]|uniref:hypothetical protein n=1 Tax=Cohnella sp. 56 TaxID=3113722 RepID=UPI0030E7C84A
MHTTSAENPKLTWRPPALEVLRIEKTMEDGGHWAFTPTDGFYKRSLLLDS